MGPVYEVLHKFATLFNIPHEARVLFIGEMGHLQTSVDITPVTRNFIVAHRDSH